MIPTYLLPNLLFYLFLFALLGMGAFASAWQKERQRRIAAENEPAEQKKLAARQERRKKAAQAEFDRKWENLLIGSSSR